MAKVRVHELAKELGITSKEAITKLSALGIEVKSHSSTIDEVEVKRLKDAIDGGKAPAKPVVDAKPEPAKAKAPAKSEPSKAQAPAKSEPTEVKQPPVAKPVEPGAAQVAPPVAVEEPQAEPVEDQVIELEPKTVGIAIPRGSTVEEFANKVGVSPSEIIKMLLSMGEMKTITQSLSDDAIELLADELGTKVRVVGAEEAADDDEEDASEVEDPALLKPRGPIVTVMGHVDHGKSSILQQYRKKEMLSLEAGGITQAIGAYQVHTSSGRTITFIDTPGHEAFTQMRARGAQVTDVAILVVAADDGVQPQTVEALDHARAAGVPVIVAVNKIDKPESDPTRVRQQLAELGLSPEEWGGDTVYVDISAKQGTNLDDLLEMVNLVADLQELKANPSANARGVVIEAHLDKGRGAVATLIVQRGTLKVGDPVVCGTAFAKVRSMLDEVGRPVKAVGPSSPVLVTGWSRVPSAGDEFKVVADEREAKRFAQEREARIRHAEFVAAGKALSLEELLSRTRTGELPELKLILKADTQGSIEALDDSIQRMDQSMVRTTVLRKAVGAINENDVTLAQASGAIVVGFNVRPDAGARQMAEREGVDVRLYEIIYQLLEDIEKATKGLLAPIEEEVVTGSAQVRELFRTPKGVVAGCYVTEGKINRNARARLLREGTIIFTGNVGSLRRFKEDVREVASGYECGILIEGYNDVKQGDVIEAFEVREVARV